MNKGVLKLNKAAHLVFSLARRASISCDLLALTDFYWPRANGPVVAFAKATQIYLIVLPNRRQKFPKIAKKN